jgi:hypothetical protein
MITRNQAYVTIENTNATDANQLSVNFTASIFAPDGTVVAGDLSGPFTVPLGTKEEVRASVKSQLELEDSANAGAALDVVWL